jgi:MHS family proline/betaine transporter-like MFS transporter
LGVFLASSLVAVFTARLSAEATESWGWRVPFCAGSLIVLVALAIRTQVRETPLFDELLSAEKTVRSPLKEGLRRQWRAVLLTFALAAFHALSYYLVVAFVPVYLVSFVKVDHAAARWNSGKRFQRRVHRDPRMGLGQGRTQTGAYCRMHRVLTP